MEDGMQATLRVCLLADYTPPADEGMKKTAFELSKRLEGVVTTLRQDVRSLLNWHSLRRIRAFSPQVIHYFHGPTTLSLLMMRALSTWTGGKTVISAIHPQLSRYTKPLLWFAKSDLILAQSSHMTESLMRFSKRVRVVPSGVDTAVFRPPSIDEKMEIRKEFGFEPDERVGLHVGSIASSRNLLWVAKASRHLDRTIVVGSTSTRSEGNVLRMLLDSGCQVYQEYVPDIHRLYMASDVYLFPTHEKGGSIDFPLTVLEALASGLPVIAYPTPALTEHLTEGNGLAFVQHYEDFGRCIDQAINDANQQSLRHLALQYSWDAIVNRIVEEYALIVREERS